MELAGNTCRQAFGRFHGADRNLTSAMTDTIRLFLFPAMMAFAASSDLFTMTISNRVSLILVAGFAVMAWTAGMSGAEALSHIGAAAAVLAVTFTFFARGWIGGGDAKLAAATALWIGFDQLLNYVIYASLFGGAAHHPPDPVPHAASAGDARPPGLGGAPAPDGCRRALRHRARGGRARGLSANLLDAALNL